MKRILSLVVLVMLVLVGRAYANDVVVNNPGVGNKTLELPEVTEDRMPIFLGTATDPQTGQLVKGYAIVRYEEGHAKPPHAGGPKDKGGGGSACYDFLAKGAMWKGEEPWVVNTTNLDGLSANGVFQAMESGVNAWEDAADGVMEDGNAVSVLGSGSQTGDVLEADTVTPDGVNEVYFADISDDGAVGVTIVWGVFSGNPSWRYLAEWDQIYDDVDYDWTEDASVDVNKMDFPSVAIHELGHSVGLGDLYSGECVDETMYGYVSEGDVSKRDLNAGDIAGVFELYK